MHAFDGAVDTYVTVFERGPGQAVASQENMIVDEVAELAVDRRVIV